MQQVSKQNKPTVLFIARSYPPIKGGLEQFSYDLGTELAAHTQTKIISNRFGKSYLPLFLPTAITRALLDRNTYDVCHLCDPVLSPIARAVHSVSSRPVTMNIHGLDILYPGMMYRWYSKMFLPSADLYICVSKYVETLVHRHTSIRKTVVIPNGIRDTFYAPSRTKAHLATLLQRPDAATRPIILTVGRLIKRKGVAWFIRSVLPLLPKDVLYAVVGDGPNKKNIQRAIQQSKNADRVILTGAVNDNNLRTLYNTADIFVMPNIPQEHDAEGFGLVALEAASCKIPVVAAATQGIVDAIHDTQNGILANTKNEEQFSETINSLLQDQERKKLVGERARTYTLEHFSWNVIGKQYLDTFRHIQTTPL